MIPQQSLSEWLQNKGFTGENAHIAGSRIILGGLKLPIPLYFEFATYQEECRRTGLTMLADACMDGDVEGVKEALKYGANINELLPFSGYFGCGSALHWAAREGDLALVTTLIENVECDQAIRDSGQRGYTALHLAIDRRHEDVVACLVDHKNCPINTLVHENGGPLHQAMNAGQINIVRLLLKHDDINVNLLDIDGVTPINRLWSCTDEKGAQLLKLLLNHGADPNNHGRFAGTAISRAYQLGYYRSISTLLEYGANPLIGEFMLPEEQDGNEECYLAMQNAITIWRAVPSLTDLCIFVLKRRRSQTDEEWLVDNVPDGMVTEYFSDWKGADKWIFK